MPHPRPHAVIAWTVCLLIALPAAAAVVVDVTLGFEGHVRPGEHAHVRIDADNPGDAERLTLRLRENSPGTSALTWELPLDVPSRSRRTHFLTFRDATGANLTWSLDGGPWRTLPGAVSLHGDGVALAVAVTSRGQSFPQLRASVDPQGRGILRVASVKPDHAPTDPAAWAAADVILVDAEAATQLSAPSWRAIEDRVLVGAMLIVHGAELGASAPASLLAGHAGEATIVTLGATGSLPARIVEPAPGAGPVVVDGAPVAWAAAKRHGLGRVVTAGVNLHDVAPRAGSAEPWLGLLAVADADGLAALHRRTPRLRDAVRESGGGQQGFRASALLLLGCVAMVLVGAAAVAAFVLGRHPRHRDRAWWLIPAGCALLSVPPVALGLAGRILDRGSADFVVEEVFPDAGRRRVTTYHGPWNDGDVPTVALSSWPASLASDGPTMGAGTFVAGARPRARGFRATIGSPVSFECERWDDSPAVFEVRRDGEIVRVRNLTGRSFLGVAGAFDATIRSLGPLPAHGEVESADAFASAPPRRGSRSADPLGSALPSKVLGALLSARLDTDAVVATSGGGAFGLHSRGAERVVVVYLPRDRP